MAKAKQSSAVGNRPLYSRMSYLYQAAFYLAGTGGTTTSSAPDDHENQTESSASVTVKEDAQDRATKQAMSRHLLTDMRSSSLKGQIRLSPAVKHSVCKYCDTLLIEGETSTSIVENKSKNGRKPWADVLVVTCAICGGSKRFPVDARRQKRRPAREPTKQNLSENTASKVQDAS